MPRVVLDINVLVSAALTPQGEARAILRLARSNYDLLVSDFMRHKIAQVLRYPHIQSRYTHLTDAAIASFLAEIRGLAIPVFETTTVTASSDPEDNRILAAAVDGQADYLVTRNLAHFPASYGQIKVLAPADFHALIRSQTESTPPDSEAPASE